MRSIILFLLNSYLCAGTDANAQSALLRSQIQKILKYEEPVNFNVVPGIVVGVIDGDSTYKFTFGKDVQVDGIYELGSLTKPFVAELVNVALHKLGKSIYDPVCQILPDSLCNSEWSKLTVKDLLTHQAGLIRMPPGIGEFETQINDPYRDYAISDFARDLRLIHPSPGKYKYSNIGYAMTNWLFQEVGGLAQFTEAEWTGPFSLEHTGWNYPPAQIAPGFGMDGRPQPPWNTNALAPALGLKSSMADMLLYLKFIFMKYQNRYELNTHATRKEIRKAEKEDAFKVVDGWFLITQDKSTVFYHTGRTGGHQASAAFIPYLQKGVVVFSNGALGSNDLSLLILRMIRNSHTRQ